MPYDIDFSPDGKILASCSRNTQIRMWDVASGEALRQFNVNVGASEFAFSPDGKLIAVVGDGLGASIYDVEGKLIHSLCGIPRDELQEIVAETQRMPMVSCVAFSPDGKKLLTGNSQNEIQIWDTATGKELAKKKAHTAMLYAVAWSPDGRHFASASYDGTSQLWNAETYEPTHMLHHERESTVFDIFFTRNSEILFTCGNNTDLVAWNAETGEEIIAMRGHGSPVITISMSSDGKMIASTGSTDNSMRFWDVESGETMSVLRNSPSQPSSVRFSPVEPLLFATGSRDGTIRLWTYEGQEIDDRGNLRTEEDGTVVLHQEVADDHLVGVPWQSFKSPVDGAITRVEFQPLLADGHEGDLSIYVGEGIRGERIHTQRYVIPATGQSYWKSFDVNGPVALEKGQTYTVELAGAQGMMHSATDRYGDGRGGGGHDMVFRFYFKPADK